MPELPEIIVFCQQMNETIIGKQIDSIKIYQPKCLNRSEADYHNYLPGQKLIKIEPWGKWIKIILNSGNQLFINLGMGGELIYFTSREQLPDKIQFLIEFKDGSGFYVSLWWFGYFFLVVNGEANSMTDNLGDDVLEISLETFRSKLSGRRGAIKSLLLNQKNFRGIGNFYIQEILFQAKLHPLRQIINLTEDEICRLYAAIQNVMRRSIELGSSSYENDFFGEKGNYSLKELSVAYEKDGVCPECGTASQKIKTGSTAQYICPACQVIPADESHVGKHFQNHNKKNKFHKTKMRE